MTDFTVTITDEAQLAGITWAREKYNASLPPPPLPPDTVTGGMAMSNGEAPAPMEGAPLRPAATATEQAPLETDDAYVQWVMEQAAASYALQQEQEAWRNAYEEAQSAGRARTVTPPAASSRGSENVERQ